MSSTLLFICLLAQADPPAKTDVADPSPLETFKQEASEYAIRLDDRSSSKLAVDPKPLLHWSNPARTAEDGAVFVWLKDGRPEVIGTMFTYKIETVRRKHEFHSLSTSPLTAEFKGKLAWKPGKPGVKFQSIPGAQAPAETSRLRQVQMKSLARDYAATIKSLEGEISELRLLPQPLYHYEPKDSEVLEGSLFSFALGTDPEVLLMIEARRVKNVLTWQYAFARFNYAELSATFKGEQVWHVDSDAAQAGLVIGDRAHIEKIYTSFHLIGF